MTKQRLMLTAVLISLLVTVFPACTRNVLPEANSPDTNFESYLPQVTYENSQNTGDKRTGTKPILLNPIKSPPAEGNLPETDAVDEQTIMSGNSAFAFDLYQQLLSTENGNLFYSPYSISIALAMAYAGAEGDTETQMSNVMHYNLPEPDLHDEFSNLSQVLAARGEGAEGADGEGFRLNVANAMWGQEDYRFQQSFLDTLEQYYDSGMRLVDYKRDAEEVRQRINDWVSEKTEERIENILPERALNDMTRLVLTNAIYFNAAWANVFNEDATRDAPFTLLDGSVITVPMMHQDSQFGYAIGPGYEVIELMYDGEEIAMDILLPEQGTFEQFESSLSSTTLNTMLSDVDYTRIALTMPKFEFESGFSLKTHLEAMGMPDAFDEGLANFTAMYEEGELPLFITAIFHKAFVKVNEAGTEAAASTAVVFRATCMPPHVSINRPFIFVIRDLETGTILFVGRVVDPSR